MRVWKQLMKKAFHGTYALEGTLHIPASVTTIGAKAFKLTDTSCDDKMTGIEFAAGSRIQTIGDCAFENRQRLTGAMAFPDSLEYIGTSAFDLYPKSGAAGFTSVTFSPNSNLETIGDNAFYDHNLMTRIVFPASLTYLGSGWGTETVTNLNSVYYRCSAEQYMTLLGYTNEGFNANIYRHIYYDSNPQVQTTTVFGFNYAGN